MSHYESGRISVRPDISRRPRTAETHHKGFSGGYLASRQAFAARFAMGILMLLLFLAGNTEVTAQTPSVQTPSVSFSLPDSAATDVELTPSVTIEANLKIDSLEVTWGRWDSGSTLNSSDRLTPTVLVIRKHVYDNKPDTLWNNYAQGGVYRLTADTTLTFTPFGLDHATEYVALLHGIALLDDQNNSVQFADTLVLPFTATLPAHQVQDVSLLPGDQLSCQDTITVTFNRNLDSVATALGPILEIERIEESYLGTGADSTSIIGDSATVLPANLSLSSDTRSIHIVPQNRLASGESYRLAVNTRYWTGDASDDVVIPFGLYTSMQVEISAASTDTNFSYLPDLHVRPQKGDSYYLPGDSILLHAPANHDGWTFVEWQCPEDPSIDGETATDLTLHVDCSDLRPRTITALYNPPASCPLLQLSIDTDGGEPLLFVPNQLGGLELDSLGFVRNWNVCPGETMVVVAQADSGHVFSHWISKDPSLNGNTSPVLWLNSLPSGITTLQPSFPTSFPISAASCHSCIGNADVIVDDPGPGLRATDIVTLTPDLNGGPLDESQVPGTCPGQVSFTATIKPQYADCYEIYQVDAFQEMGGSTGFSRIERAPVTGGPTTSTATMTADCKAWATFHVRRKQYRLTVEQAKYPENPTADPLTPEENALVEVRVTSREPGAIVRSAPGKTAEGIRYIEYTVKACATVDIVAMSHSEEVYFQQYSCLPDVECDADPTDPRMSRRMDHNIKVRALYKHKFRLEKVEFRRHGTTDFESFSPDIGFVGDVNVEKFKDYNPRWKQVSTIRLTFSDPVDLTTVEGNIFIREFRTRIDRNPLQSYKPSNSPSATWSNGNRVLRWEIDNVGNDIGITKCQLAGVYVREALKSTAGDNLEQRRFLQMETEYPGLEVILKQFKTIDIGELAPGHGYVMASGYHSVIPSIAPTAVAEQTPISGNRKVIVYNGAIFNLREDKPLKDPDGSILRPLRLVDVDKMGRDDEIMFGAICIEIDGDMHSENLDPQTAMLNDARNRIRNRVFYDDMARMWREVTDPYIHGGFWDDDDENIGEVSTPKMYTRLNWFGTMRSTWYKNDYYYITGVEEGKTRFGFRVQFKPDPRQ